MSANTFFKKNIKILDGSWDEISGSHYQVEINGCSCKISVEQLVAFDDSMSAATGKNPEVISKNLGFKVIDLGSTKVFRGRKNGLRLFYSTCKCKNKEIILIFSFGEFQPGRFICYLEAALA